MERGDEAPQDSTTQLCIYCRKGFESSKALYGHLLIHIQATIKTGNCPKQDEAYRCLVCNRSFSSARLLCQHRRIHRRTPSNGVRQPTFISQESGSLSEAKTVAKQGIESTMDLLKDMVRGSQTLKRGLEETASDHDIIYHALPLMAYFGPEDPHMETRKKKKIEETMACQDTSMEGVSDTDSESTVEQLGNYMAIDWFGTHDSNNSKSRSWHGRRSTNKSEAVESVHQCEICGRIFATGQALGGHKTAHRDKDPLKVKLEQAKTKQESCGEVKQYVTRSEESRMPEQTHPKKMLDFDLNIPYQE